MDAFDKFDADNDDLELKKQFIVRYKYNQKILKNLMGFLFMGLGLLFILLGVGLFFIMSMFLYVFGGMGLLWLIMGIIFYNTLGKSDPNKAYERYKNRIYFGKPIYSSYESSTRIIMLETRVKKLEEELERIKRA